MLLDGSRPWLDPGATSLNRLPVRSLPADALSLDGTWEFELLGRPEDLTAEHLGDRALGRTIEVPGAWTMQGFARPLYTNIVMPFSGEPPAVPEDNPTGIYRRTIRVPGDRPERRTVLRVGAAESMVFVYLDGSAVGYATDSRLASDFDLTPHLRAGGAHTLALVVPKWSAATWIEDQDQWWHGGLQRSVWLYETATTHLSRIKLVAGLAKVPKRRSPCTGTLEVEIAVEGPARREPGWSVEVRVAGPRNSTLVSTGRNEVPHWDDSSAIAETLGAMLTEPGVIRAHLEVPGVGAWSAERPDLHAVTVKLRDPAGRIVETDRRRVGFRSVEVRDRQLLVNGSPVMLRGVNIHEHDPDRGRTVSREHTRRDLTMIKAANLNAVRASHYPHDEHFAELCDEIGLYVVDEANVESHAREWSLCHDPAFGHAIVERVERMARRDVHHPSVIIWSLGNESGYGTPHDRAAAFLRRWDPSRPIQYESPFQFDLDAEAPVSDIVCPMYTSIGEISAWARRAGDPRRPLILCEYSHAMGNACGSLAEYDAAFEAHEGLQGGFIWEWVEHGLPLGEDRGPDGAPSWGYGGDFGDVATEGNFVLDGLVGADRVERPVLGEVRFLGRPVRCDALEVGPGSATVSMHNRRWFTDTADLIGEWDLRADGEVVADGELPRRPISAQQRRSVRLRWPLGAVVGGAEHVLTVRWRLAAATSWARKGHLVGWDQFAVPVDVPPERAGHAPVRAVPELPEGFLECWRPTVFRALTDNDGISQGWMRGLNGSLRRWVDELGLDRCSWDPLTGELRPGGDAPPVRIRSRTEELDDGWHRLVIDLSVPAELADPPRLGVTWELPSSMESLEFYGDGPRESYPDRRAGSLLGRWRSGVAEQYVGYGMPQEHGHHTSMRWVALREPGAGGRAGRGVIVVGDGTQGFSARHHGDAELWTARHTGELTPLAAASSTYLSVDVAQRGLGQSSLGEEAFERYRIRAGRHRLDLLVRGLGGREDPGALYAARPR